MDDGVNFRIGRQDVVALVVVLRLTQALLLVECKPMRGIGVDVGIIARLAVLQLVGRVKRLFRRADVETVVAEPPSQAVGSPPDLRGRFGRPGNVQRPAFVAELELDVAGVRGDVAEQRAPPSHSQA